jgi:hypothetical protein
MSLLEQSRAIEARADREAALMMYNAGLFKEAHFAV